MKPLFLILLFFSVRLVISQTITGVVKEKETGLPLPFANVFVNNTTIGAAADEMGNFHITGDFPEELELVASFVGYVTVVQKVSFKGKKGVDILFELSFNQSNLLEVELKAKRDKTWERNFRKFEEVFLALPDDPYLMDIEIHNPWVVEFEKVSPAKGQNYVRASAQEPLKMTNKALGYEIDFYLQDFWMRRNASRFLGQVFYSELESEDSLTLSAWKSGKELNFQSSIRHLNRSILLNNLTLGGFELYHALPERMDRKRTDNFTEEFNKSIVPVVSDSIFRRPLGNGYFRVFLPGRMEVHHLNKTWKNDYYTNIYHAISWIQAPEGYYDVDRNGILINPTQLVLSGYMGRQRMARSLPFDFDPDKTFKATEHIAEVVNSNSTKLNRLREKVWLTFSKPYFYPGETAWIGGRMLFQEPSIGDSLSRVVYVDLIDANLKIVQSETFEINQGKIDGGLVLPTSIFPGDYVLRAYTRWNQNFPEKDIFLTPFLILEPGYMPVEDSKSEESYYGEIEVKSNYFLEDSLSYRVLDLKLDFLDGFQNPIDGDYILSVTNAATVSQLLQSHKLELAMDWLDEPLLESFQSELAYPIEYGISLQGSFIPDNKRRPPINPITIVRGDLEDYARVTTDSSGSFWATGLYFTDTAQIAVAALSDKMRPYGKVEIMEFLKPAVLDAFPKFSYTKSIIKEEEQALDISGDFILLEEFVKEEMRQESMVERNYGYGEPDRKITQDQLEKLTFDEIWGLLRFSGGKFGNFNYGEKTGTPLLIIDGSKYPFLSELEFKEIFKTFEPSHLESIEVFSSNISKSIFGMAGYSGVIIIETKKGFRTDLENTQKFNSEGFQIFPVRGFSKFSEFPKNPPSTEYLRKRSTLYWDPLAKTDSGTYQARIKIPYGVRKLNLRLEGLTEDGEPFYKLISIEF